MSEPRDPSPAPGDSPVPVPVPAVPVPDAASAAPLQDAPQEEPAGDSGASAPEVDFQKVFGAVQRALQMASYLPVEQADVTRVAVVSRQGQLIASAALHSRSQARFLLDQLHPLGFSEGRSTAAIQDLGCDLLLVHEAGLEQGQGIVRVADSTRWPPENQ